MFNVKNQNLENQTNSNPIDFDWDLFEKEDPRYFKKVKIRDDDPYLRSGLVSKDNIISGYYEIKNASLYDYNKIKLILKKDNDFSVIECILDLNDLNKEYKNAVENILNITQDEYDEYDEYDLEEFKNKNIKDLFEYKFVYLSKQKEIIKLDFNKGNVYDVYNEFMDDLTQEKNNIYFVKVVGKNKGGFIVEYNNVLGFLPGAIAAANKLIDFDSYVGRYINVMLDSYLEKEKIFVFSYKKYVEHILPSKIDELSINENTYKGFITGVYDFGVFVEFDEIFTGLLHVKNMNKEYLEKLKNKELKPGDELEFKIIDIIKEEKGEKTKFKIILSNNWNI